MTKTNKKVKKGKKWRGKKQAEKEVAQGGATGFAFAHFLKHKLLFERIHKGEIYLLIWCCCKSDDVQVQSGECLPVLYIYSTALNGLTMTLEHWEGKEFHNVIC